MPKLLRYFQCTVDTVSRLSKRLKHYYRQVFTSKNALWIVLNLRQELKKQCFECPRQCENGENRLYWDLKVIFFYIIRAIVRNKWRQSYLGLQYKAQTFWIEEKMFLIFPLVNWKDGLLLTYILIKLYFFTSVKGGPLSKLYNGGAFMASSCPDVFALIILIFYWLLFYATGA